MKYAITGHTAGLGLSFYNKLSPDCLGFSRATGYDISKSEDRARIIQEAKNCDVFINNAHVGYHQTELLYELFAVWKGNDKLIISIGSDTTSGIKKEAKEYTAQKASLDKANEQLAFLRDKCKVSMIKYGFVGTERIIKKYNPDSWIDPIDAAEFLVDQISWCRKYRMVETMLKPC